MWKSARQLLVASLVSPKAAHPAQCGGQGPTHAPRHSFRAPANTLTPTPYHFETNDENMCNDVIYVHQWHWSQHCLISCGTGGGGVHRGSHSYCIHREVRFPHLGVPHPFPVHVSTRFKYHWTLPHTQASNDSDDPTGFRIVTLFYPVEQCKSAM